MYMYAIGVQKVHLIRINEHNQFRMYSKCITSLSFEFMSMMILTYDIKFKQHVVRLGAVEDRGR